MKKIISVSLSVFLVFICLFSFSACKNRAAVDQSGLWENAMYLEDTALGNGSKTAVVEVKAGDKAVIFTVKTDKATVGAALLEHNLIAGDDGQYGLYIKTVNGIKADYDTDGAYWAFYVGDEYASSGVDSTNINEGLTYKLVYSK